MSKEKARLGRGLDAIFGENVNSVLEDIQRGNSDLYVSAKTDIPLDEIRMNPYQPRQHFDEAKIEELAQSIREHGVFTPVLVRQGKHGYELIAGERRVRASRVAGRNTIPAIIMTFTDDEMLEISLIENIQREDLNVIEEATAYSKMVQRFGYTQDDLAKRVGKSREHIANTLRLLRLPQVVQQMVSDNKLQMGHVRPLITLNDDKEIIEAAKKAVNLGLSVRAVEQMVKKPSEKETKKEVSTDFSYVRKLLEAKVQSKVSIDDSKITITYHGISDLNRILEALDVLEKED